MARVRDLWHKTVKQADGSKIQVKTARHPDNGGSKTAKRWLAVWTGPDGREETRAFRVKTAAEKHIRAVQDAIDSGTYFDAIDDDSTEVDSVFGDLAEKWLRLRMVGAATDERYERVYRLHVRPAFADRPVRSIKPSQILEWLRQLATTHGQSTQALAYLILAGVLDLAVADDSDFHDNPARSPIVTRPTRDDHDERHVWSTSQVWSVIDAHPDRYRLIPIIGAGCGTRLGETLAVAEDDFDFSDGKVCIRRQIALARKQYVFKAPKGGKDRIVPIASGLAEAVKNHIATYPPRPYTLPWLNEDGTIADKPHTCNLLLRWESSDYRTNDGHVRAHCYNPQVWKPALAKAGIIPAPTKNDHGKHIYAAAPDDGTHILRHYLASLLLDAGVSLAGVMAFLGHSKKGKPVKLGGVTLGVYGHVTDDTYTHARNAIDTILFAKRPISETGTEAEHRPFQWLPD